VLNAPGIQRQNKSANQFGSDSLCTSHEVRVEQFGTVREPNTSVRDLKIFFPKCIRFTNLFQKATSWVSHGAFLPQNAVSKLVNKYLCGEDVNNSLLCKKYIVYKLFGEDSVQFDMVTNQLNHIIGLTTILKVIFFFHRHCYPLYWHTIQPAHR